MEAFIYDYIPLIWLSQKLKLCELKVEKDSLFAGVDAFAMSKNFKRSAMINEAIHHYHESKDISRLQNKWFSSTCNVSSTAKLMQQDINSFSGLIFVLCATALACFPMLIPEHFYDRFLKNILHGKRKLYDLNRQRDGQCTKSNVTGVVK